MVPIGKDAYLRGGKMENTSDKGKDNVIHYCKRCVMPDTKPDLHLDTEGICNACRSYERRGYIDWASRKDELIDILEKYRCNDGKLGLSNSSKWGEG